jgi:hypothetical protein
MNGETTWHIDSASVQCYARHASDAVMAASVEAHVAACGRCAAEVSAAVEATSEDLLFDVWAKVDEMLDEPRISVIERLIRAVGCPPATSRVIAATGRAQWSCLSAVVLSLVLAVFASTSGDDAVFAMFLLFAPIGPLAATAAAFERFAEPVENLLRTVPTSLWTIALVRSASAVVPSIVLTALSIPILSERGWLALAWMLPSLALSVAALALTSWLRAEQSAVVVTLIWISIPVAARLRVDSLLEAMAGPAQVASMVLLLAGGALFVTRRTTFDYRGFS